MALTSAQVAEELERREGVRFHALEHLDAYLGNCTTGAWSSADGNGRTCAASWDGHMWPSRQGHMWPCHRTVHARSGPAPHAAPGSRMT